MYRPLRDLNGIPGAKNLIMCLTGYQRQDRDDIMVCVAHFVSFHEHLGMKWNIYGFSVFQSQTMVELILLPFMSIWEWNEIFKSFLFFVLRLWLVWWGHSFLSHWWLTKLLISSATNLKVWFLIFTRWTPLWMNLDYDSCCMCISSSSFTCFNLLLFNTKSKPIMTSLLHSLHSI